MPHYCRICGRSRRNEKFSGGGRRNHICKDCQRLPRDQRDHIERMDELCGFLDQSNISGKNIARLEILAQHASSEVKGLALLILEVARVKPHKRRRWKFLEQNHSELFLRLKALFGDDIPEADLSALDLDILPRQDLEFGEGELFHSGRNEATSWENDPYWLVASEDEDLGSRFGVLGGSELVCEALRKEKGSHGGHGGRKRSMPTTFPSNPSRRSGEASP
jgi:hypothetical protein